MKSYKINSSTFKSTLKILHVAKHLKEGITSDDVAQKEKVKRKSKEKKKVLGQRHLRNKIFMMNINIYCQIYSLEIESSDIVE